MPNPDAPPLLTRVVLWGWLGYWLLLFTVMHLPRPPGAHLAEWVGDKCVHAGAYFLLATLGGWWALRRGRWLGAGWLGRWCIVYAVYAAVDEWLQQYVNRACELGDWFADVVGASTGLAFVLLLAGRASRSAR